MGDFKYYNANVLGKEEEDCVIRAISVATRLSYGAVARLLDMASNYYRCEKLNCNCYGRLLTEIFGFPVRYCDNAETVEEIINKYSNNTLLLRIDGHLSCSIAGVIFDIWDCTKKLVDCYWIVPNKN